MDSSKPSSELEYYKRRCAELEGRVKGLESENRELKEKIASLETTVNAVVARSIDAKADTGRSRWHKKPGRRRGHEGASRARSDDIDETVALDQSVCHRCGGVLSEKPTDSYTRVVEDIVPARAVTTKYVVRRRYCCTCRRRVSLPSQTSSREGATRGSASG